MMNFAYGDKYSPFLHDAVILYAIALNETIAKGLDCNMNVRRDCSVSLDWLKSIGRDTALSMFRIID